MECSAARFYFQNGDEETQMRFRGTIVRWGTRGFGFIQVDGGGDDVFVHIADIFSMRAPKVGQRVEFELKNSNRPKAVAVTYAD